jgi:hypothetical protein
MGPGAATAHQIAAGDLQTPSGNWAKRDKDTGRIMDVKTSEKTPFKGVRKEK